MRLVRRGITGGEQTPLAHVDVCLPEQHCIDVRIDDEGERFSPQTSEFVNDMVTMSEVWGTAMRGMPDAVSERRVEINNDLDAKEQDRSSRRQDDRLRDVHVLDVIAWAHNAGRYLSRPELPPNAPKLSAILDPVDLARRIADIGEMLQHEDEVEEDTLVKQFKLLFIAEEITHAQMSMVELTDPKAFRDLFEPGSIVDLPESLQQLAAIDISREKDSIILRNARRTLEDTRTPGEQLADYITNNHLPETIRHIVVGISLGAKAMNAPACPLNDVGLCTKVLERLPLGELPEPLRRDIEIRANKVTQDRIGKLVQFSKTFPQRRLFDSGVLFEDIPEKTSVSSKKRRQSNGARGTKADKRDIVFEDLKQPQEPTFNSVSIRVGNEPVPLIANVGEDAVIDLILDTKLFRDYKANYRGVNLDELLSQGLHSILFTPNYTETAGMIVPLVDKKKQPNQDGVIEKPMRFSGQKSNHFGSGKVGRQTRIIFYKGDEDGVRHITIKQVTHKSDIEKGIRIK